MPENCLEISVTCVLSTRNEPEGVGYKLRLCADASIVLLACTFCTNAQSKLGRRHKSTMCMGVEPPDT